MAAPGATYTHPVSISWGGSLFYVFFFLVERGVTLILLMYWAAKMAIISMIPVTKGVLGLTLIVFQ